MEEKDSSVDIRNLWISKAFRALGNEKKNVFFFCVSLVYS